MRLADIYKIKFTLNSLNYSFLEFFHNITEKVSEDQCKVNVSRVLLGVLLLVPDSHNVKGLVKMSYFMLCFCDEENAFWILSFMLKEILPAKFTQPDYTE